MGVQISEIQIDLPAVQPSRIYQATVFDFVTLVMIIMPQLFRKIDLIHGDGGVGTTRIFHFPEDVSSMGITIDRVDVIDEEKLFYSVTILKGPFPTGVEIIQDDLTFNAAIDGTGTVIKRKIYFYTTGDTTVNETFIAVFNERAIGILKAFEAYLVANPDD